MLHTPMFRTSPAATSASIAAHVSASGTRSNSIRGCGAFGSWNQPGGYRRSNGTNCWAIGKWIRYRSR